MLNQLIESKNNAEENKRESGFLLTTLGVLVALLLGGWTYSLFAKDYGMGGGDLELSSLIAPVVVNDETPPTPEPDIKPDRAQKNTSDKIILKNLYEDMSKTTDPPKNPLGEKEIVNARQFDLSKVKQGATNQIPDQIGRTGTNDDDSGCKSCGLVDENKQNKDDEKTPEVVVKTTPKPTPIKPVSLGVVNGQATYLAKPPYPQIAKDTRVIGAVNVQVLIDEKGNVISASAVSGHPLLRSVSEKAALASKFTPTLLSKQPVRVTGIIIYKFSQ